MNAVTSLVRRSPLVSFFVLTYALSWGVGALFAGVPLIAPDRLFGAGPLVALIVAALASGRAGLRDLGRRLLQWRVGLRWYAMVLVLPILLVGTAVALIPVFGGTAPDWTKAPDLAPMALMLVVFLVLPLAVPLGEEIGWRGFALPRFLTVRSPLTASLILGVIWSLWHLPVVLDKPDLRTPAPFLLTVIPTAALFTWLFLRTGGSLLIAVLFHAWSDLVLQYFGEVIARSDYARLWWLLLTVESIVAGVVLLADRHRFTAKPEEQAAGNWEVPDAQRSGEPDGGRVHDPASETSGPEAELHPSGRYRRWQDSRSTNRSTRSGTRLESWGSLSSPWVCTSSSGTTRSMRRSAGPRTIKASARPGR